MMKKLALVAATFALVGFTMPAFADGPAARQATQEARIHQGVKSGELTRKEARKLRRQQRHIRRMRRRAHKDGKVTRRERRRIRRAQNRANRNIRRKKHNAQTK